jgi:hypothetical protein
VDVIFSDIEALFVADVEDSICEAEMDFELDST